MDGHYDRYCRYCGAILDPESGTCPEYECYRCGRRPGELLFTRRLAETRELRFLDVDCLPFEPAVVTTSADVYGPEDPVHVLVAAGGAERGAVELEIRESGVAIDRFPVTLSEHGNAHVGLGRLGVGVYSAHLAVQTVRRGAFVQSHLFRVACRDLSVMRAVVLETTRQAERLAFRVAVSWMAGDPYEGPLEMAVLDDHDDSEIFRVDLEVKGGRVAASFRTQEWVGPFSVRLATPGGDSTWVRILDQDPGFRDEILGLSFGPRRRLTLSSEDGDEECHGIRLVPDTQTEAPIVPAEMIGPRGELIARRDIPRLYLQVRHPGSGGKVEYAAYTRVSGGERIPFSATPPYCFYLVAADFNDPAAPFDPARVFEGWGVFFVWSEERVLVRAPRRVEPGSRMWVEVDGTPGTEGFLVVRQKGLPATSVTARLSQSLFENIRSNSLLEGPGTFGERDPSGNFEAIDDAGPANAPREEDRLWLVPGIDRLVDGLSTRIAPEVRASRPAIRQENLDVLAIRHLVIQGPVHMVLRSPSRIGEVETVFYQCGPRGWRTDRARTEVASDSYVEGSLPSFLFPGEHAEIDLRYRTARPALLVAKDPEGRVLIEARVAGEGLIPVGVECPGTMEWSLGNGTPVYLARRTVRSGGTSTVTRSVLWWLSAGEELTGTGLQVYPDPRVLEYEIARNLADYPHACSEQLSSRLWALSILWRLGPLTDAPGGDSVEIRMGIRSLAAELVEYARTMGDGRWAIWPEFDPRAHVAVQVLRNLTPYLTIAEFPELTELATRTRAALAELGAKDEELADVDASFAEDVDEDLLDVESASARALGSLSRRLSGLDARFRALERLASLAETGPDGRIQWTGRSWAGIDESTAKAARALVRWEHALAPGAVAALSDRLIDGRLYSTTDTRAMIELVAELAAARQRAVVEIDGKPLPCGDRGGRPSPLAAGRVRCLEGRILVRSDREELIRLPVPPLSEQVRLKVATPCTNLEVGQRVRVQIEFSAPDPESMCRVFLPPTLGLSTADAEEQEIDVQPRAPLVEIDCVCLRRGEGRLRAILQHLYRRQDSTWVEGPRIRVS